MVEIRRRPDELTTEQKIAKRLQNSGVGKFGPKPDVTVQTGSGPQRVFHNVHRSAGHVGLPVDPNTVNEKK